MTPYKHTRCDLTTEVPKIWLLLRSKEHLTLALVLFGPMRLLTCTVSVMLGFTPLTPYDAKCGVVSTCLTVLKWVYILVVLKKEIRITAR
jgi:hypothetical protein